MPFNNYKKWFDNHGKSVGKADSGFVVCDGAKFSFHSCMQETDGYRGILGYGVVGGRYVCRMWYYSKSEASWRASTGLRENSAWQKGFEEDTDKARRAYTGMGYIFECLVTVDMSTALENFWIKTSSDSKVINGKNILPPKMFIDGGLERFLKNPRAEISIAYNNERFFKVAALPVDTKEIKDIANKYSSTSIQSRFSRTGDNIGKQLRMHTDTDAWLTACLNTERRKQLNNYHPLLKLNYDLFSYSLADKNGDYLTVEIAATTTNVDHDYVLEDGKLGKLETKICWVRDVYYNDTAITSFGTRKNIPINLSFLVQKPIDYISQVSASYLKSISDNTKHKSIDDAFRLPQRTETEKKARQAAIYALLGTAFNGRGGYNGSYIILSYLNECTSTLIHEFKRMKGIPSFTSSYNKPVGPSLNTGFNHGDLTFFNMQQELIIGINEYLCLRLDPKGYDTKGYHADSGYDRARALREAILGCKDESGLNKVVFNCFIKNKIDSNGEYKGFSGGLFSQIRTYPTSLFTCICRSLLFSSVLPPTGDKFSLSASKHASVLKGDDKGISRMKALIHNQSDRRDGAQSAALFITSKAPELLVALKG